MLANRRTFWKVRRCLGQDLVGVETEQRLTLEHDVAGGRDHPGIMLKKVVFPAPLGPMTETISLSTWKSRSESALRPRRSRSGSGCRADVRSCWRHLPTRRFIIVVVRLRFQPGVLQELFPMEFTLRRTFGISPRGASHHPDEQCAIDQELELGEFSEQTRLAGATEDATSTNAPAATPAMRPIPPTMTITRITIDTRILKALETDQFFAAKIAPRTTRELRRPRMPAAWSSPC